MLYNNLDDNKLMLWSVLCVSTVAQGLLRTCWPSIAAFVCGRITFSMGKILDWLPVRVTCLSLTPSFYLTFSESSNATHINIEWKKEGGKEKLFEQKMSSSGLKRKGQKFREQPLYLNDPGVAYSALIIIDAQKVVIEWMEWMNKLMKEMSLHFAKQFESLGEVLLLTNK